LKTEKTPEHEQLTLLICSASVERPELCVTPLVHALAARALDCTVEIHFAGPAIRLLVEGVAAGLYPTAEREKSLLAFLQEAAAAGVTLLACSMAQAAWVAADEKLITECHGHAGATLFVVRTLDPDWRTLVY
jgi:predicted peroxiredoxin